MRCGDCRFYREGQGHGQGWCHRHAPAPAVIRYDGPGTSDTFWPPVDASDGCGDFEAPGPGSLREPERRVYVATMEYQRSADGDVFDVVGVYDNEEDATVALYDYARGELGRAVSEGYRIVLPVPGDEGRGAFETQDDTPELRPLPVGEDEDPRVDWDAWGDVHEEVMR